MNCTFMDKLRSFLGFPKDLPRNEFRNPIWNSDEDSDEDEFDTRNYEQFVKRQTDINRDFSVNMFDMVKSFENIFMDLKTFLHDTNQFDTFSSALDENQDSTNVQSIRDYYLKPGYHRPTNERPEDLDLDGKISSNDISGLFKEKDHDLQFNGDLSPVKSFCQTIITTSITKPDGTIETRRIVKNGNKIIEETTTSLSPSIRGNPNQGPEPISTAGIIPNGLYEIISLLKNFN